MFSEFFTNNLPSFSFFVSEVFSPTKNLEYKSPTVSTINVTAPCLTKESIPTAIVKKTSAQSPSLAGIPIQLISPTFSSQYTSSGTNTSPSSACGTGSVSYNSSVSEYNGILGVGLFLTDGQSYFGCSGGTCSTISPSLSLQLANPVASLSQDNNGVLIELPSIGSSGSASATGTLLLGIGTESNNSPASLEAFETNTSGDITGIFNGANTTVFFDSGSNGLFFSDSAIPSCKSGYSSWYCPTSTLNLSATISGLASNSATVNFAVDNAISLFAGNAAALNDLAGNGSHSLDLGLPFFYGRDMGLVFDTQNSSSGTGPLFLVP